MAKRKYRMRKWRASGHKHKHNKASVASRKILKRLKARQDRLLIAYFHTQQKASQCQ